MDGFLADEAWVNALELWLVDFWLRTVKFLACEIKCYFWNIGMLEMLRMVVVRRSPITNQQDKIHSSLSSYCQGQRQNRNMMDESSM